METPQNTKSHPEFVSLPSRGGDPVCGLSRSFWYSCEQDGLILLRRIRRPGQIRGRVLLPVSEAVSLVNRLGRQKPTPKLTTTI